MGIEVGFLFDNDGVLIDSSEFHFLAWEALAEEDSSFTITRQSFEKTFGMRNDLLLKTIKPESSPSDRERWGKRKEEILRKSAAGKISLLPGIEAFLKEVKRANIPRIIASSTSIENLNMYLSTTILGSYFDQFVSAEEVAHGKPFPDVFIEAAKRLKLPNSSCIVFEDAPSGIVAGIKAGSFVVALATTHAPDILQEAHLVYKDATELKLDTLMAAFKRHYG